MKNTLKSNILKGLVLSALLLSLHHMEAQDTFIIQSAINNNLVLSPEGNSNGIRKEIKVKDYKRGKRAQQWVVQYSGDGDYFYLKSAASNYVLDVKNGSRDIRTPVWTYAKNRGNAQKWKKVHAGGGYFYLQSKLGHYLDVKGGVNRDGNPVWTYAFNKGNAAQRWKFVPADASYVPPRNCNATPCQSLNGSGYRVVSDAGQFAVSYRTRDGLTARIFKADRREDVEKMKKIMIDHYNIDAYCKMGSVFIPKKNGREIRYGAPGDRCTKFNIFDLHIRQSGRLWNIYHGPKNLFTLTSKNDALRLLCVIKADQLTKSCEIGNSLSPAFVYLIN
ncbi:MAG: RICIN domain-containing protein [Bacteroidota bacterium]